MQKEPLNSLKYIVAKMYVTLLENAGGNSIICLSSAGNIGFPKTQITDNDGNTTVLEMSPYDENDFRWSFETSDITFSDFNNKYINQIAARLLIMPGARVDIDIRYDFNTEWDNVSTLSGAGMISNENCMIKPARCKHFRLRFSGIGDMKLIALAFYFNEGNEK
jgi:hypothetical protein